MSATVAILVVALLATSCSSAAATSSGPGPPHRMADSARIRAAHSFREYSLYWLGRRYGKLALTGVATERVDVPNRAHTRIIRTRSHTVTFLYGSCCNGPASDGDGTTCNWPVPGPEC